MEQTEGRTERGVEACAEGYSYVKGLGCDASTAFAPREPRFKRPLDVVLSGFGLLLSAPLWTLFSCWIWLEDGRPIFFRQMRIGWHGRVFRAVKFRSMIQDSKRTEIQATKNDPRITRVGRVMRKTAMDELPQLWNIFTGDMSFVGPRSQPEKELVRVKGSLTELFIRDVPGFAVRQSVRPGLTGVAQIFAPREVPHRAKFRYDLIYVRRLLKCQRRGLLGDLELLFYDCGLILRSIWTTFRGKWEV